MIILPFCTQVLSFHWDSGTVHKKSDCYSLICAFANKVICIRLQRKIFYFEVLFFCLAWLWVIITLSCRCYAPSQMFPITLENKWPQSPSSSRHPKQEKKVECASQRTWIETVFGIQTESVWHFLATLALNVFQMLLIILINNPNYRFNVFSWVFNLRQLLRRFSLQVLITCKGQRAIGPKDGFLSQWVPQWVKGAVVLCCWRAGPSVVMLHRKLNCTASRPHRGNIVETSRRQIRQDSLRGQDGRVSEVSKKGLGVSVWKCEFKHFSLSVTFLCLFFFCFLFWEPSVLLSVACSANDADMS